MLLVARAPIEFKCGIISPVDFEMDGVHAHFARSFFGKGKSPTAITAPPISDINVQFVDECIVSMEFEAEPHRQHNITHGFATFREQPHSSEFRERQKLPEGCAQCGSIKFDECRLLPVKKAHHTKKFCLVLESVASRIVRS